MILESHALPLRHRSWCCGNGFANKKYNFSTKRLSGASVGKSGEASGLRADEDGRHGILQSATTSLKQIASRTD